MTGKLYPASLYRDPSQFVRFASEKCDGCRWEKRINGSEFFRCALGTVEGKRRKHGNRCEEYLKGDGNG